MGGGFRACLQEAAGVHGAGPVSVAVEAVRLPAGGYAQPWIQALAKGWLRAQPPCRRKAARLGRSVWGRRGEVGVHWPYTRSSEGSCVVQGLQMGDVKAIGAKRTCPTPNPKAVTE